MARPAADSVRVTWTGTGTGTMSLGVVVAGFQAFPADFDGEVVSYAIENAAGTQRENGFGTYTAAGNTLTRDFVTFSTAGAPLKQSFSSGDKHVRVTALAHDVIENRATTDPGASNDITQGYISGRARWLNTTTDLLWSCVDHTTSAAIWAPMLYLRNSGTFNPAAINLAATRGYNTFVQSGAITFALSGATHVDNATATVRITGDGTNNIDVDGVTVLWADGSAVARQWSGTQTVGFWYSSNIGAALAFAPSQGVATVTDVDSGDVDYAPAITGIVSRTVESRLLDVRSVKDFGAVGNDTANDTAAFQAALNSFPNAGGVLLVPPGVYRITSTLTWPRRTDSTTFSKAIVLKSLTGHSEGWFLNSATLHFTPTSGVCLDIINGTRNAENDPIWLGALNGLCFLGEGGTAIGVLANRIVDGSLENLQFKDWGTGLQVQGGYWKTPLRKLQFENAPAVFDPGTGSSGSGALSNGAMFESCTFKSSSTHGLIIGENGNGASVRGIKFHNCFFENNAGYGVRLWSRTGAASVHNSTNAIFDKIYAEGNSSGVIDFIVDTTLEHWSRLEVVNSHIALPANTPLVNWRGVTALSRTMISTRGVHYEDAATGTNHVVRRDAATIAGLFPRMSFIQGTTQFLPSNMRLYSGNLETETAGYWIEDDEVAVAGGLHRNHGQRRNQADRFTFKSAASGDVTGAFTDGPWVWVSGHSVNRAFVPPAVSPGRSYSAVIVNAGTGSLNLRNVANDATLTTILPHWFALVEYNSAHTAATTKHFASFEANPPTSTAPATLSAGFNRQILRVAADGTTTISAGSSLGAGFYAVVINPTGSGFTRTLDGAGGTNVSLIAGQRAVVEVLDDLTVVVSVSTATTVS